jgi:hypothetical protein
MVFLYYLIVYSFTRTMLHADCITPVTGFEFLQLFDETLADVKRELKQEGREEEFIGAKVSLSLFERTLV